MEAVNSSAFRMSDEKIVVLDKPSVSAATWIAIAAFALILIILYRMKRQRRNNNL